MVGTNEKQKRERNLNRRPAREFSATLSKDGSDFLFRDTTVWFIPSNYLAATLRNRSSAPKEANGLAETQTQENGGRDDRSR